MKEEGNNFGKTIVQAASKEIWKRPSERLVRASGMARGIRLTRGNGLFWTSAREADVVHLQRA